jgi:hypothetical protein
MSKIITAMPLALQRRLAMNALLKYGSDPDKLPDLWAGAGDRTYAFDANMGLADGAAAQTATGFAQYAGADGLVDLGGNQGAVVTLPSIADVATIVPQQARIDAVCVVDIVAIGTTSTNLYKILLLGSNNPAFAVGSAQALAELELGAAASLSNPFGFITPAPPAVGGSRYELLFTNEQNNVKYQWLKLYAVLSGGGSPSFQLRAFVAVLPEP